MTDALIPTLRMDQPARYLVWVQGAMIERWRDWFDAMEIRCTNGELTCLCGTLPDQAALLGFLQRLYALGYPILKVEVEGQADAAESLPTEARSP